MYSCAETKKRDRGIEREETTSGTAKSYLSDSNVNQTRKIHQVMPCCFNKLLKEAHRNNNSDENVNSLSKGNWIKKREAERSLFQFWSMIEHKKLVMIYLSLRTVFAGVDTIFLSTTMLITQYTQYSFNSTYKI